MTFPIPLISCCDAPVAGRDRICQSGSHVAWGSFSDAFRGIGGCFLLIFFPVFLLSDVRAAGRLFLGRFLEPPLYIGVIMARLRSIDISPVFIEALYSSWRGWARLLLHCLRSIAGNSSGSPEEFREIVFIASMMSSLVILMSDSVFACGCQKKSFEYLLVIVGSGVLRTLLYCSFRSLFIFLLLGSRFLSSFWRGPIPASIVVLLLRICKNILGFP